MLEKLKKAVCDFFEPPLPRYTNFRYEVHLHTGMVITLEQAFDWDIGWEWGYDYPPSHQAREYQKQIAIEGVRFADVYYAPSSISKVTFEEIEK